MPAPFRGYDARPAEKGIIEMNLARRAGEKTAISLLRSRSPLLVQRVLYPDARFPEMGHIYLMTSSGGLLQGDRLSVSIIAGENSLSHVTTQASTKVYKMYSGFASQKIKIHACRGSYIEFMPHSMILYRKSRLYSHTDIELHPGATVLYSEILSAGRIASGEQFVFDTYCKKLNARDAKGNLLFAESMLLEPNSQSKNHILALFGSRTILCTIYIFCETEKIALIEKLIAQNFSNKSGHYATDKSHESVIAGYSKLPYSCGIVVKMLSDSIDRIMSTAKTISTMTREHAIEKDGSGMVLGDLAQQF